MSDALTDSGLRRLCIDWDNSEMPDEAETRLPVKCGELRALLDRVEALTEERERALGTLRMEQAESRLLLSRAETLAGLLGQMSAFLVREADSLRDYPFEVHETSQRLRTAAREIDAALHTETDNG